MKGLVGGILIATGVFFIMLSGIFFIAALAPPMDLSIVLTAIVLLVMGLVPIGIFVHLKKHEKTPEVRIENRIVLDASDLASGKRELKGFRCRTCNAPLTREDIHLGDSGLTADCPYCGSANSITEEPKW